MSIAKQVILTNIMHSKLLVQDGIKLIFLNKF